MAGTGFYWDEHTFWHGGGHYAMLAPVGGLVQPMVAGGLPEGPEGKRRLRNLLDVTGLLAELEASSAPPASRADLERVHPARFLDRFKALSDEGGGELGVRAPFGPGGYEIAALSAGLALQAVRDVLHGDRRNAYALCRPPGHHCGAETPMGFCLLNNIAVAVRAAQAEAQAGRIAIVDWDVHHGNGTEAIFYGHADVLTISLHQDRNFPLDTGGIEDRGAGPAEGSNINIPLPPGAGHATFVEAMMRIVVPALGRFRPDIIVVACGFDASGVDPLSRTLAGSHTFREMTRMMMTAADQLCDGRLVLVHEGGYSELHVPFCAHAVVAELASSKIEAADPLQARIEGQQPDAALAAVFSERIGTMASAFGLE
ncbi:MAG: class II histone deacetylase [Pseudomonadota bacterium]